MHQVSSWGLHQGGFRIITNQWGVGKNEIYNGENLVRPFLVHKFLGSKPLPPLPRSKDALGCT